MPKFNFKFTIPSCPVCHLSHEDIQFHEYLEPNDRDGTHFVICPTSKTILTYRVKHDDITYLRNNAKHSNR